ncbi:DIS3 mitotic control [Mortierella sp. NVP85]|nr:DIS3 mitotic control [Mortierella sp. NVP85]
MPMGRSVAFRYLDLLEQEELTNFIFTETVLLRLHNEDKTRTYRSLRRITRDSRRSSIVFCNEHCEGATVVREPKETLDHRDWRALNQAASWYRRHLLKSVPIILLSEKFKQEDLPTSHDDGITVMSLKEYLDTFWPFNMVLHELLDSLKEAILEEDLEEPNQGTATSKKGHGVTGYQEYKPMSELEAGVKSERFFQGIFRVRANHRDQAFIRGDANIGEIVIVGNEHRNRAVHGDVVVVELLDRGSWIAPSTHISYNPEEVHAAADDEEELANQHRLREVKPTGRVVGVISRNWQPYVATLQKGADRDSGSFHMVVPLNPVLPRIRIRHHDPKALADQRIVVRIDSWPCSSVYPNGHYVRTIGPIHELDTEISAILIEHGISVSQTTQGFSAASLKEMPINTPERPWTPDPAELMKRRDMRKHTVFSIDPPNCQDIDDAISIREIENDRIEFGVHIADVSYFVKESSQTDLEAMSRGTTVYLSDRRFDMLPKVLSEQLCSLRHRVDRYAMSVIWTLDSEANVINTWFGRTVIRSACEMEYEQAQQILDGMNVIPGLDAKLSKQLKPSVILLAKTMRKVRARRVANGALELASSEVKFKFKEEDGGISGIQPKQPLEIHRIIEEAMVMANAAVAKRIYDGFQDSALLRNHPPPIQNHFKMLLVAAESKGFTIDTSSNLALATSLRECAAKSEGDEEFVRLLMAMTTMAMSEASYISSGSRPVNEFTHYGLALEYYTHFTSPIRRYADLVVHRQLLACILRDAPLSPSGALVPSSEGLRNDTKMRQVADHLNRKNRESKLAQRDSTELFQTLYVLQKTRGQSPNDDDDDDTGGEVPLVETGIIAEIRENGFFVFLPRLGVKGPVYLKISSGDVILPLSALSGSRPDSSDGNRDHLVKVTGCDLETDHLTRITVRVPEALMGEYPSALTNTVEFRLFDTVRVALRLRKSYEHRHSIYLRLIGLEQGPTKESTTPAPGHRIGTRLSVESKELDSPSKQDSGETNRVPAWSAALTPLIRREQQQPQQQQPQQGRYQQQQRQRQQQQRQQQRPKTTTRKVIRRKPEELSPDDPYLQTHMDYSLYNLIEWFDRFHIIESDNY